MSFLRAIGRLAGLCVLAVTILPFQVLVAGPLLRDYDTVPALAGKRLMDLVGINLVFTGVAPEKRSPMIYMANHQSYLDPWLLYSFLKGACVSKAEHAEVKLMGGILGSVGTIFVRRNAGGKFIPQAHDQLVKTLNAGRNVIVFPEGTTSDGSKILPFRNGVLSVMFNNLSGTELKPHVRAQGFAIAVTHVNGQAVSENPSLRDKFAWYGDTNGLSHLWCLLKTKNMRVEVTGLPVMDPDHYAGRKEFARAAEELIRQAACAVPGSGRRDCGPVAGKSERGRQRP
jgi:1-acyl-sn-glycerol-3-phosphate acyltransferase